MIFVLLILVHCVDILLLIYWKLVPSVASGIILSLRV